MSSGLLDFFTLEASEYVEHLDGLVAKAGGGIPDLDGWARHARALRGSATMAKVGGVADVATALERVAHGLHVGTIGWNDALRGAVVSAIDDLKILIRGVRTWSVAETNRATARALELAAFAPAAATAGASAPNASVFLSTEAAEISRQLAAFSDNPVGPAEFARTLQRVRGLRGIALLKDLPPLPEVVDALDQAAKAFELGGAVTPALRALFSAAAAVLADGSVALMRGNRPSTESAVLTAFAEAAGAFGGGSTADDVVPISALFPDDGLPGVVSVAPSPPTTASQRFRLEVVSQAEHMRRLIGDAAQAVDAATRERLARELGAATLALSRMAASFGETTLAAFFTAQRGQATLLARAALDTLDRACDLLSAPHGRTTTEILRLVSAVPAAAADAGSATESAPVRAHAADAASTDAASTVVDIASLAPDGQPSLVSTAAMTAAAGAASSGDALAAMLAQGLQGLSTLEEAPLAAPAALADDVTVPIEDLVYRGRDALDRAIELRDLLRQAPGAPDAEILAELFDLLELAATAE